MDDLYHKTKQTTLEIEEGLQKLDRLKQSQQDTTAQENELLTKINLVKL